jgi:hypothetical protein
MSKAFYRFSASTLFERTPILNIEENLLFDVVGEIGAPVDGLKGI